MGNHLGVIMELLKIRAYSPEVKPYGNVQYFCDEKGRDWYEYNSKFTKKYVVQYNDFGVVKAVVPSATAVMIHPEGTSVSEVNVLPKDFSLSSAIWLFDGKKFTSTDTDPSIPTKFRKGQAQARLNKEIEPLKYAVDLGEATKEEIEKYDTLRKLSVKLMRISDDTPAGEVDWAEFTAA